MTNVEFNDETNLSQKKIMYSKIASSAQPPALVVSLIKHKIVKNEKQALWVLIGVIIICVAVSFYLFRSVSGGNVKTPSADDITAHLNALNNGIK
ncbi:MAG: hypothetical protein WCQ60_03675 [bacterium]